MDTNEDMKPATKGDINIVKGDIEAVKVELKAEIQEVKTELKAEIENLAITTSKSFTDVEARFNVVDKRLDEVQTDVKLILSAIEIMSGQNKDAKQGQVGILDHVRLERRVEVVEEKLGIKN